METKKIIIKLLIIGFVVWLFSHFLYQICFVHGPSMEPTLHDKEIILIKKFHLNLDYSDIIVIKKQNKLIIKRIIGMPGDTVKIDEYPFVNGKKLGKFHMENNGEITNVTLKKGEYFVLGDNCDESIDSRFEEIGIIKEREIIGKKIFN